jgi:hypothetical protein
MGHPWFVVASAGRGLALLFALPRMLLYPFDSAQGGLFATFERWAAIGTRRSRFLRRWMGSGCPPFENREGWGSLSPHPSSLVAGDSELRYRFQCREGVLDFFVDF